MAPRPTCECGTCAKCKRREYMRGYYARNAEKVKAIAIRSRARRLEKVQAYDRERGRSEDRKAAKRARRAVFTGTQRERERASKRSWKKTHRVKNRAQKLLHYHVKAGHVQRQPCEVCGASNAQAHHDDYSKPLEVRWLCPTHHGEQHRKVA